MHIVYADPTRVVRARAVLRQQGILSDLTIGVPTSDEPRAAQVSVIEVADGNAERAKEILTAHDLMGAVGGLPASSNWSITSPVSKSTNTTCVLRRPTTAASC